MLHQRVPYRHEQLFKVVWHSNLSVCVCLCFAMNIQNVNMCGCVCAAVCVCWHCLPVSVHATLCVGMHAGLHVWACVGSVQPLSFFFFFFFWATGLNLTTSCQVINTLQVSNLSWVLFTCCTKHAGVLLFKLASWWSYQRPERWK